MFTAICLTRLLFDFALKYRNWKTLKMRRALSKPNFQFLSKWKAAFALSGFLIVASLILFIFKGEQIFGVDFTGGTRISYLYEQQVPVAELEKLLKPVDANVRISYKSSPSAHDNRKLEILIRDRKGITESNAFSLNDRVTTLLNEKFPQLKAHDGQETTVGGLVGAEAGRTSVIALLVALLGMSIYIAIRFELSFALAALVGLVHVGIVSLGIFILMGREISLPIVAAVLTVVGYSLNDTIVVFDRIREELKLMPGKSVWEVMNLSINRTLSRTVLTSGSTLLVVVVMFCFGGIVINDFVLVIMIGVVIGTYSTIFISSPLAAMWHRKIGTPKI
ncbi:Protein translocase subunit SecF [bioreactor metagenome]|uniref:Protein translocase subunit SecF n=1 Tax=bioreactor metagenome TaxID=1076179 RepID=A0A645BE32_9ZZZZ